MLSNADIADDNMSVSDTAVFFFKNADFRSLENIQLTFTENLGSDIKRQNCVLVCRQLIFADKKIIASPVLQHPYSIHVILQDEHLFSPEFQNKLCKLPVRISTRQLAQPEVFQTCFSYTATTRLAPLWNKVGSYFCQGKDFLITTRCLPAIQMEVVVTQKETEVTLRGCALKLQHMTLKHIWNVPVISAELLQNLHSGEVTVHPLLCFVLPSMKEGYIVSVSFKPFNDGMFSTTEEIRCFWKDMYGYHIPEDAEGSMIYVKVVFQLLPTKHYTYPILCVQPQQPLLVPRINPLPIMGAFVCDMEAQLREVCSCGLSLLLKKPAFPTPAITWTAAQVAEEGNQKVGWTSNPCRKIVPYKAHLNVLPISAGLGNAVALTCREIDQVCKASAKSHSQTAGNVHTDDTPALTKPTTMVASVLVNDATKQGKETVTNHEQKPQKIVPRFPAKLSSKQKGTRAQPQLSQCHSQPLKMMKIAEHDDTIHSELRMKVCSNHVTASQASKYSTHNGNGSKCEKVASSFSTKLPSEHTAATLHTDPLKRNLALGHRQLITSQAEDKSTTTQSKKLPSTKAKKPASAPPDADVKAMIRDNKPGKINAATLLLWLREKGVPCRCKDKKADLVAKATALLQPEP